MDNITQSENLTQEQLRDYFMAYNTLTDIRAALERAITFDELTGVLGESRKTANSLQIQVYELIAKVQMPICKFALRP